MLQLRMGLELKSQSDTGLEPNLYLELGPEPKSQLSMGLEQKLWSSKGLEQEPELKPWSKNWAKLIASQWTGAEDIAQK